MTEASLGLITAMAMLLAICVRSGVAVTFTGNVAKNCIVKQSSVWADDAKKYLPAFAVDGKQPATNTLCSCTKGELNPWLSVTLPQTYMVAKVAISYPVDCCDNTINGAEIRVGNSLTNNGNSNKLVATVNTSKLPSTIRRAEYTFTPVEGRYVNVILPHKKHYLIVCELEVYAVVKEDLENYKNNVALKGRATQSSLMHGTWSGFGLALHAVDGNREADLNKGSCSHTHQEKDPWWRVDLLRRHSIYSVSLTNRGDCCAERLSGAVIHVGDSLESGGQKNSVCAKVTSIPAGESKSFKCGFLEGRYVTIVVPGEAKVLVLCEVEVYGLDIEN